MLYPGILLLYLIDIISHISYNASIIAYYLARLLWRNPLKPTQFNKLETARSGLGWGNYGS